MSSPGPQGWFVLHKLKIWGNSLEVQWLGLWTSTAGGSGLIPGGGTKILQDTQWIQIYIYIYTYICIYMSRLLWKSYFYLSIFTVYWVDHYFTSQRAISGRRNGCCCCSVTKSYPTLHDPMDCSMPGFPVHYLPEFSQIQIHWISDAV